MAGGKKKPNKKQREKLAKRELAAQSQEQQAKVQEGPDPQSSTQSQEVRQRLKELKEKI